MRPATPLICQFIDVHKDTYGVAPICRALVVRGVQIAPRTYWAHRLAAPSKRALWDTTITEILAGLRSSTGGSVRHVRREPPTVRGERVIGVRSQRWWRPVWGGSWTVIGSRFGRCVIRAGACPTGSSLRMRRCIGRR